MILAIRTSSWLIRRLVSTKLVVRRRDVAEHALAALREAHREVPPTGGVERLHELLESARVHRAVGRESRGL